MADAVMEASPYVRAQNNLETLGLHEMSALLPDYMRMVSEGGADLLFQLVGIRYEQRSTMITTNVGIGGWAKVFGDEVAASAIADRICHHCHMVRITGRSYRPKDVPVERKIKEE